MKKITIENLEDYGFDPNSNAMMEAFVTEYIKKLKNIFKKVKCDSPSDAIKLVGFDSDLEIFRINDNIKEVYGNDFFNIITSNVRTKKVLEEIEKLKKAWGKVLIKQVSEDEYLYDLIKKNPRKSREYLENNRDFDEFKALLENFKGTKKTTLEELDIPDSYKEEKNKQKRKNSIKEKLVSLKENISLNRIAVETLNVETETIDINEEPAKEEKESFKITMHEKINVIGSKMKNMVASLKEKASLNKENNVVTEETNTMENDGVVVKKTLKDSVKEKMSTISSKVKENSLVSKVLSFKDNIPLKKTDVLESDTLSDEANTMENVEPVAKKTFKDSVKEKLNVLKTKKDNTKLKFKKACVVAGLALLGVIGITSVKNRIDANKGEELLNSDDLLIKDGNDSYISVSEINEENTIINNENVAKTSEEVPSADNQINESEETKVTEDVTETPVMVDDAVLEDVVPDTALDADYTFIIDTEDFTITDDAVIYGKASDIGNTEEGYTPKYREVVKNVYKIVFDLNGEKISVEKDNLDKCLEIYRAGGKVLGVAAINEASKNEDGSYTIEGYYGIDDIVSVDDEQSLKLTR